MSAHTVLVTLGRSSAEMSVPQAGVLRMLFRRPETTPSAVSVRGGYAFAVSRIADRHALVLRGEHLEGEGVGARLSEDGLTVLLPAADATMTPVLTLESIHETPDGHFVAALAIGAEDPFFGLGEQTGPMNRRHRRVVSWNLDHAPHTPSTPSLYASFPVLLSRTRDARDVSVWYGLFLDNPGRSVFDLAVERPDEAFVAVDHGDLDLYVIAGPTPAEVVRRYCGLTGTIEMPPRWMLGYQQSRWTYTPAARVLEVARAFRAHDFPCDAIYLDIDHLDRFRAFTWDAERFPDPEGLTDALHGLGFKVVPIVNGAVAVDAGFAPYREGAEKGYFLRQADGTEYHAQMWPGQSAFPDFTRAEVRRWWGGLHSDLLDLGVDGIWNDMNEPTVFGERPAQTFPTNLLHTGEGFTRPHAEVHNAYGALMNAATREGLQRLRPGRRLPLLTRAAYAGSQRHAAIWTGDNSAWWEHLRMGMAQICNLGLSGMALCGTDVGGFHDEPSGELFLRWLQMAVFFPFLRAHSMQGTRDAEPWCFGQKVLEHARRIVGVRYALLPYLYTLAAAAARHGDPITRPLLYDFPHDRTAETVDDQVMLGPDLLVAPVLSPGQICRAVYLPHGEWRAFFGEASHQGSAFVLAEAPLDRIPLFVRGGSVIPMARVGANVEETTQGPIEWHVWPLSLGTGHGWLYEDDGETDGEARARRGFCETHVRAVYHENGFVLRFAERQGEYVPAVRTYEVVVHAGGVPVRGCSLAGARAEGRRLRVRFDDDGGAREVRFTAAVT